jgi:hypothetical protein
VIQFFELVSEWFHREDCICKRRQFVAEMRDVNVDGSGGSKVVITPDMIENHVSGEHASPIFNQVNKQFKFFRREFNFF